MLRLALDVTRRQLWDLQNKESYFAIKREFYSNLEMRALFVDYLKVKARFDKKDE